jgi:hypothetical protein
MFNNLFSKFRKGFSGKQKSLNGKISDETLTQVASGSEEEKPSGNYLKKGCIITLIILLLIFSLFLFALFYPVKKTKKDVDLLKRLRQRTTGESRFDIISAKIVPSKEGELPAKAVFLIVTFKVENIAKKPRVLNYSMVKASAGEGTVFAPSDVNTDRFYESLREKSPWDKEISTYTPITVHVVFVVSKGTIGFKLLARDFDWTSSKAVALDLGL